LDEPGRELFVWAVLFNQMPLAIALWKQCPEQLGSALVARLMLKRLAKFAQDDGNRHLAEELEANARLVVIFCCL